MDAFELSDVIEQQRASDQSYFEFIQVPSLSVGLYVLPTNGIDEQTPHTEDEVYHVLSGRAMIRVADEDRPVQAGSVVFAGAGVEHRFHSIQEELRVLVFFAPAEGSGATPTI